MRRGFRLPMWVIAAALLGLIALLATLQHQWLGRISDAERERLKSTLSARATAYARDFDRELTLAYMLFQIDPLGSEQNLAARLGARLERWQSTAAHPKLIKDVYVARRDANDTVTLQRYDATTRFLEPAQWPESLREVAAQLAGVRHEQSAAGTYIVRAMAQPVWEKVPALVIPMPLLWLSPQPDQPARMAPNMTYTIVVLDKDYIAQGMLPALTQHHFRGTGDGFDYQLAVVSSGDATPVYKSTPAFSPDANTTVDADAPLFQIRAQEFSQLAADVRRFTATLSERGRGSITVHTVGPEGGAPAPHVAVPGERSEQRTIVRETRPMSVFVEQPPAPPGARERTAIMTAAAVANTLTRSAVESPRWRLVVQHPSGSLEAAVDSARRRNLLISTSILAVLGASMALLVVSTRRAQQTARQQMEFVAVVSHELRTPLAVIRSAGDNLADGVVSDPERTRRYGELVRSEGRRLSEMVEQILEFSGIHSGQRPFVAQPVDVKALVDDVLGTCEGLLADARMTAEVDVPPDLPPALGDASALRRVLQNLISNAIKYGADGAWLGIQARATEREVQISVRDRGIGIEPAEQQRIFEPFYRAAAVVAAQIQGAGLGLSLVRRIVEAHGGRIFVRSAPGAGSEFIVHLPRANATAEARQAQKLAVSEQS
jgi:signal transduction histidine kinase